ncbi:hypothetical protein MTO96_011747 [Rhipicephalus appendiculatus]
MSDLAATATTLPEVEFPSTHSSEGCQETSVAVSVAPANEPEAGPSQAEALKYSVRTTANRVMDCVLAEFRARPVVHTRLGNVPLPDFNAGEARVCAPRFWDLNAVWPSASAGSSLAFCWCSGGGFPKVKSLQVEDIGEIDVASLIGVPVMLKWLATKVIRKVIRDNSQVIARLASNEFKDVLQDAISDQDLGSILKDALATEDDKSESSGKRKSSA